MNGNIAVMVAYSLGLGLMLGYALMVWNARRRAERRSARAATAQSPSRGREGSK